MKGTSVEITNLSKVKNSSKNEILPIKYALKSKRYCFLMSAEMVLQFSGEKRRLDTDGVL